MKPQALSLIAAFLLLSAQAIGGSTPTPNAPMVILNEEISLLDLEEEVYFYAAELGLDSTAVIRVVLSLQMPEDKAGLIEYQCTGAGPKPHQILIYLNKRNTRSHLSSTLAHEMVHARQFVNRELTKVSDEEFIWKGERYANVRRIRHAARPWEIEAIDISEELRKAFLSVEPCPS